jgi:hypothetical protein
MKRLIFVSAVIVAGFYSLVAHAAAPTECFANSGGVFSAHPNATHASYIAHGKRPGGSGRCWYADAFKAQTQADAKPMPHPVGTIAKPSTETSALRHQAPSPQPRVTAVAPSPQPRTTAVAPVLHPITVAFPTPIPPAVQISVNARELSQLLPADESPTDFNGRFSVSGYRVPK